MSTWHPNRGQATEATRVRVRAHLITIQDAVYIQAVYHRPVLPDADAKLLHLHHQDAKILSHVTGR